MFYKECFTTFVTSLRKTLTTNKLERTKAQPEELPFLPASFMSFYQIIMSGNYFLHKTKVLMCFTFG